jgi:hypothetical protein
MARNSPEAVRIVKARYFWPKLAVLNKRFFLRVFPDRCTFARKSIGSFCLFWTRFGTLRNPGSSSFAVFIDQGHLSPARTPYWQEIGRCPVCAA